PSPRISRYAPHRDSGPGRVFLAGRDLHQPVHHRPRHHRNVMEWSPVFWPARSGTETGGGVSCPICAEAPAAPRSATFDPSPTGLSSRGRLGMEELPKKVFRCAIYTRNSSEHNLDLEFNSLDAQREACEAYIKRVRRTRAGDLFPPVTMTGRSRAPLSTVLP